MSTVNGNLIVYEALKNKQLAHITPIPEHQSFCVVWNQIDPKYICMTSAKNAAFVIEVSDLPACKTMQVARQYIHPNQVFGCAWNPMNAHEFITACQDGLIRLFDISNAAT